MNVLVIAPHPDDEAIGCGGTICLHVDGGDRVAVVFLTSGESGLTGAAEDEARRVREGEARNAARILGVSAVTFLRLPDHHLEEDIASGAKALRPILEREKPEVVYLTHERDFHPDHRATVRIVERALAGAPMPAPVLLSYEILTPVAEYDYAQDISHVMERKLKALRAHRSQIRQFRYDTAVRALNRYRGVVARSGLYAEVFRLTDGSMNGVPLASRADPGWHRVYAAAREIARVVPPGECFILVDDGLLAARALVAPRKVIPFLEKDGCYWGKPADSATAIRELERLRGAGARFMVFARPAFWWLEHYAELNEYLEAEFRCIHRDGGLIVFDLRRSQKAAATA
jgi:N-acetylglucosamine malate deacetylase 1